jgi:hypothetical protein
VYVLLGVSEFTFTLNIYMPVWSMAKLVNVAIFEVELKLTVAGVSVPFDEHCVRFVSETLASQASF